MVERQPSYREVEDRDCLAPMAADCGVGPGSNIGSPTRL